MANNLQSKSFKGVRFLIALAALIVVIAGLKAAQGIVVPFLYAIFLAILGGPVVIWLQQRRIPTVIAVLLVTLTIVGALAALSFFVGSSVNAFTARMPDYQQRLTETYFSAQDWLRNYNIEITSLELLQAFDPKQLFDLMGRSLRWLMQALSGTFLTIIIMVFLLFEAAEFRLKLRVALGDAVDMERFGNVAGDVQRYLGIKTTTSALTGVLVGGWATLMGVQYALLWGFIAFLLNYIPYIGSFIAAIPAIVLALIDLGPGSAGIVTTGYVIINTSISNLLEPVLLGRRLGLSPLIVFLSLVFWGYVWGPAGMLISVPLTMLIRILLEHSEDFSWIAVLMGRRPRSNVSA